MFVTTTSGGVHEWWRTDVGNPDEYKEVVATAVSHVTDDYASNYDDFVSTDVASPSQPTSTLDVTAPGLGDDGFIDVIFY